MTKSNFALRLQPSLMEEARKVARAEGVAVNQLINVAVAEKVSALRTEEYFAERAARGDIKKALNVLTRAGRDQPPLAGDELPARTPGRRHVRRGSGGGKGRPKRKSLRFEGWSAFAFA